MTDRRQRGGDHSTNIQGEVIHVGASYTEVRQIALDVFKANVLELGAQAAETAQERAEELVDDFVSKLQDRNPEGVESIRDPDMQYSLFAASRDYARSNVPEHKDMLSTLLVEKTRSPEASLPAIAISEAVEAVRKISIEGANTLTGIFCLARVGPGATTDNLDSCIEWFRRVVFPWLQHVSESESVHDSLTHAGCLRGDKSKTYTLARLVSNKFPAAFHVGFSIEGVDPWLLDKLIEMGFAVPVEGARAKLLTIRDTEIRAAAEAIGDASREDDIRILRENGMMDEGTSRQQLVDADHQFGYMFEAFSREPLSSAILTNVGLAVAHANLTRTNPEVPDLSVWLH